MINKELEKKVYGFFEEVYKVKFNGTVKVDFEGDLYDCEINFNEQWFLPTHVMYQGSDDDEFIKFLFKELHSRNLLMFQSTKFTNIKLTEDQI